MNIYRLKFVNLIQYFPYSVDFKFNKSDKKLCKRKKICVK